MAREAGLEDQVRPLVEVRLADLERLSPESPRSASLTPDVVLRRGGAGRLVRPRQCGRGAEPALSASRSVGSTRTPASGGTNSGGPPMRVATTERAARHRLEQRLAERLDQARLADDVRAAIQAGSSSCGTRPRSSTRSRPRAARAAARRRRRSAAPRRAARKHRRAGRRSCAPSGSRRRGSAGGSGDAVSRGSARSGRGRRPSRRRRLAARLGKLRLELAAQVVRHGDHRDARVTTRRVSASDPGSAPMLRTSRPCAVTTSGASTCEATGPTARGSGRRRRPARRAPRTRRASST